MGSLPRLRELALAEGRPFDHETGGARGKPTRDQRQGLDGEYGFIRSVESMKMWRGMIVEEHPNNDA